MTTQAPDATVRTENCRICDLTYPAGTKHRCTDGWTQAPDATVEPRGPYMNEDGDWWVPVTVPFVEARRLVRAHMDMYVEPKVGYVGREVVPLTEHEYGCNCDPSCHREVEAWHFEERGVR